MEVLLHQPYTLPVLLRADWTPIGEGRSPGRHLSEITRAMQEASGGNVGSIPGEQPNARPQLGFFWERALERSWAEYQPETRPVTTQLRVLYDGIEGTPDGFHLTDLILEEYKYTQKTLRKWEEEPEAHFVSWLAQTKGYLHMMNHGETWMGAQRLILPKEGIFKVRFLVYWVMGDYSRKEGRGTGPWETILQFTSAELEEHWRVVKRYQEYLDKKEGRT